MADYEDHRELNAPNLVTDVKEVIGSELGIDLADITDIDTKVATIIAYTLSSAQLINAVGAARVLGVSRQRVYQLKGSAAMPPPIVTTTSFREGDKSVELWLEEEIAAFGDARGSYATRLQQSHPLLREGTQD